MATILVVDDEPHILDLLRSCLEGNGHEVHIAEHGEAGLQLARNLAPDLVILDVMLPGLDGAGGAGVRGIRTPAPQLHRKGRAVSL